jgi:hypothetical protein
MAKPVQNNWGTVFPAYSDMLYQSFAKELPLDEHAYGTYKLNGLLMGMNGDGPDYVNIFNEEPADPANTLVDFMKAAFDAYSGTDFYGSLIVRPVLMGVVALLLNM